MCSRSSNRARGYSSLAASCGTVLAIIWGCHAHAQKLPIPQNLPQNLQIHGFASQSWLKSSDNNNVFGNSSSDSGSFDFRELGLNASMRPRSNLQFSAQMLSRTAGEGSPGNIRLDYGFIDYTFLSAQNSKVGIRLGRMKNPLGFYNDTRDVPFTRPSILLPQSIYFDRTRKLAIAADGGHLYGEYRSDFGNLSVEGGVVRPLVRGAETEVALLGQDMRGRLAPDASYIGRMNYELDEGKLRFTVSAAQLNIDYDPSNTDPLRAGLVRFTPLIFSAQYNAEKWSLTSEYALRHFKYENFGRDGPNLDFFGESYYFQGAYRFTPNWEAIVRYDVLYTDRDDRSGKKWAAATGGAPHRRYAKDITVGLRWNITPELMLRAEYHRVNGTGWLSTLDNPSSGSLSQNWDLFSILGSYRF
jgi:hypothetical protein